MKYKHDLKEKLKDIGLNIFIVVMLSIMTLGPIVAIIYYIVTDTKGVLTRLAPVGLVLIVFGGYQIFKKLKFIFSPKEKVLTKCEELVDEYCRGLSVGAAPCYGLIHSSLKELLSNRNIDSSNIEKEANMLLRQVCSSMLGSGEYNSYRGEIGTMGYGPSLSSTYRLSSQWLVNHGWLSQQEYEADFGVLKETISSSG